MGVDARSGAAEDLPWQDGTSDAATVWDLAGNPAPMRPVGEAVAELDPDHPGERAFQGGTRDGLGALLEGAGLRDVESSELTVTVTHPSFEEWWEPYLHGVGPVGETVAALGPDGRQRLEQVLRRNLGDGPFDLTAVAYGARARA